LPAACGAAPFASFPVDLWFDSPSGGPVQIDDMEDTRKQAVFVVSIRQMHAAGSGLKVQDRR